MVVGGFLHKRRLVAYGLLGIIKLTQLLIVVWLTHLQRHSFLMYYHVNHVTWVKLVERGFAQRKGLSTLVSRHWYQISILETNA